MATYILKRLLLMIPTTFGITFVLWVVIVSAPGRPGETTQGFGEVSPNVDPSKEMAKSESQYIFRRHFALDRPVFWNSWTRLTEDEVLRAVEDSRAPIETVGAERKREAREQLEDWGTYAVPPLLHLLEKTTGTAQDAVLFWMRMSATRRPQIPHDAADEARNRVIVKENVEIEKFKWSETDGPDRRAAVVAQWRAWFEAHRDRWRWEGADRLRVAISDTQFATFWGNVLKGDLGESHKYRRPVLDLILERVPVTVTLSLISIVLVYLLAIPLGIFSAVRPYGPTDRTLTVLLFLLYSLPSFFAGTILLRTLTVGDPFAWFPNSGFTSAKTQMWNTWDRLQDVVWHVTLPLVTLTYGGLAVVSRFARAGMLDVIRSDYVRTARAKGLAEREVILRHAARNGMMPIVTLLGGVLPALIGGSVIVEFIFNVQGMGLLAIDAIGERDFNIVVGEALIIAILTQVGILLADIVYAVLDPRISLG